MLLIHVAAANAAAAAIILPFYYLADATLTLLRRLARGEKVWQAHREHFYQQALRNGFTVTQIVRRIAVLMPCSLRWRSARRCTARRGPGSRS